MSSPVYAYRLSHESIEELDPGLQDFDAITMQLPAGLYTTFRTFAGRSRVIGLRAHLDRLYGPAAQQNVKVAREANALRQTIADRLKRIAPDEARVRLILDLSRRVGEVYILLQRLRELPAGVYRDGVKVEIAAVSRGDPTLKQTNFILESASERRRVRADVFEVLLTRNDRILEGMTSNFFYLHGGVLHTAGRGVLAGVTRRMVIDLARRAGLTIRYRSLPIREIPGIEEAFITSSSRGVVPVVAIAGIAIAPGSVGPVTTRLMRLYEQKVLSIAEPII